MELKTLKSLNLYLQSLIETKLWFKVLVAVFAGVIVGFLISPDLGLTGEKSAVIIGDWLALPGNLFIKLVQMIMIPLIFASIIRGIISNTTEQLKSMGVSVGLYFVATTIISISIGTVITSLIKPGNSFNSHSLTEPTADQNNSIEATNAFSVHQIPHAISDLLPENPLV